MPSRPKGDSSLIVNGEEFRTRLAEEIERSERYEHPFSILVMRPPKTAGERETIKASPWFDSLIRSLVRGCDVVSVLELGPTIAVLLPETDVSGAGSLLERLIAAIDDKNQEWEYTLFEYPLNQASIEDFLEQAA